MGKNATLTGSVSPIAYAATIFEADKLLGVLTGSEAETTNNRMELMAVIRALEAMKGAPEIIVNSDSKYVVDGATKWLERWQANGWKNASNKPVRNRVRIPGSSGQRFRYHPDKHSNLIRTAIPGHPDKAV